MHRRDPRYIQQESSPTGSQGFLTLAGERDTSCFFWVHRDAPAAVRPALAICRKTLVALEGFLRLRAMGDVELVANPVAAGTGFTLTAASYSIYETLTWRCDYYAQSQDRNHRIGQRNPVS